MDKLVHYRCIDPAHEAKAGAGRYTIHNGDWAYCVAGGTSGSHQWLRAAVLLRKGSIVTIRAPALRAWCISAQRCMCVTDVFEPQLIM